MGSWGTRSSLRRGALLVLLLAGASCRTGLYDPLDASAAPRDLAVPDLSRPDLRGLDLWGLDFATPDLRPPDDLLPPPPDLDLRDLARPPMARCNDRMQNGNETDVDCGGCCDRCAAGRGCRSHLDCASFSCVAGRCSAPNCPNCGALLGQPATYAMGRLPKGLTVGDFNRDGKSDVAAGAWAGSVSVFLGRGDGTFAPGASIDTGAVESLASGDIDGDGILDLVVANVGIQTLHGHGDGTFDKPVQQPAPAVVRMRLRDLNGDNRLDLIGTGAGLNPGKGAVWVSLGNGDGTFGNATTHDLPSFAWGLAAEDVTGDCHIDLVVATADSHQVQVLIGAGDGTFGAPTGVAAGDLPIAVDVADLDGDGHTDLIVASSYKPLQQVTDAVSVLLGHGDGTFEPRKAYDAGQGGIAMGLGDLDGDGKLDVLIALWPGVGADFGQTLSVLVGRGDGTLKPAVRFGPLANLTGLGLVDLDGDAKLDVVVSDNAHAAMNVLLNQR